MKSSKRSPNSSSNYEPLPPIKQGLCGAPAPILLKSLGSDPEVKINPAATVDCTLARALSRWLPVCLLLLEAGCEAPWLWRERKALCHRQATATR